MPREVSVTAWDPLGADGHVCVEPGDSQPVLGGTAGLAPACRQSIQAAF